MTLIQIEKGYHWRKHTKTGVLFQAKKTDGGMWYHVILPNNQRVRHTAGVIEETSTEVKGVQSADN